MKRFRNLLLAALVVVGLVALPAATQMAPSGDKFVDHGTATNDNADATVAAPGGGQHLVIYGIDATCETAAALDISIVEDPGGTPVTLFDTTTASQENHHVTFEPTGLIVSDNTDIRARVAACGAGVDGHVTVWGQRER